tara:strand:- start:302 stop:709 length:408 start_codon:yes stop_codon:yes gene_type:complete
MSYNIENMLGIHSQQIATLQARVAKLEQDTRTKDTPPSPPEKPERRNVPPGSPFADENCAWTYAEWMEERDRITSECEGLANLLLEHPTAPCDQDSVFESMKRVQELREELEKHKHSTIENCQLRAELEKLKGEV